ncbi:DUF4147 domain-containing protein [Sinorhizobium meliloti]|nr:DUF4147 domain-containing protein [Sinorhizobium meliloti]
MQWDAAALLNNMLQAAVAAADPAPGLKEVLPPRPDGRVLVVGAGKASARMAQALEEVWGPCEGLVAVPRGAVLPTLRLRIVEADHPVPDETSLRAAEQMLALASSLRAGDTLVALISGGGSSLLSAPCAGLSLAVKQQITRALLMSGAPIHEMNLVRQQFSAIKGGKLAEAAGAANVLTYLVSDIPGDDPSLIASGPTIPTHADPVAVKEVIRRNGITLPPEAAFFLKSKVREEICGAESARYGDRTVKIVASPQASLEAAAEVARRAGLNACILGDAIEGEAREVGRVMAAIALQTTRHAQPLASPVAYISGGETTVTVRGVAGKGGRCSEFLLGFALAASGNPRISAIACDTDGRDGSEYNAGAIWHGAMPFDQDVARVALEAHDAWSFFAQSGGLITTGPTHTNVNDFRVALVLD